MEVAPNAHPLSKFLFEKWSSIIETHSQKGTEIEIRFGRANGKSFDTNVGSNVFSKILKSLQKYEGWENVTKTDSTVYYFPGDKRLTVDEATDEQMGHIKKRIRVDDQSLQGLSLDVRLGISSEEPFEYDGEETSNRQITKKRWSFVRKNLSIDMTIAKGVPDDMDSDEDTSYQIELEIIDPTQIQNKIELFNILHKIFDVMNLLKGGLQHSHQTSV